MPPRAFLGIYHLVLDAHPARHRGKVPVALHLRLGVRQPDPAIAMVVVDRIVRVVRQFLIEFDRMAFQAHHGLVHAKIRHLRSRMPGCSRGQFVAFDQHNIGPAFLRQVVERGASGNATTNNNDSGLGFHNDLAKWWL